MLSAGLLLYRDCPAGREVLLLHMGGPIWAKKDAGAWSIPKGLVGRSETALEAACREFEEETGFTSPGPFESLGEFVLNKSKRLQVWAVRGDADPAQLRSNKFQMIWPPRSGRLQSFPEADRAAWLSENQALEKIVAGQRKVIEYFFAGG